MNWMFACALAASLSLFAEEDSRPQKIYVSPSEVAITDQGIFVCQDAAWTPVDALFTDDFGVYVCDQRSYWECTRCGKCVSVARKYCHSCLKPRYATANN